MHAAHALAADAASELWRKVAATAAPAAADTGRA
jgi:hypothetical protein